jgi:SNF2 family DNA or RNA helicase
LTRFHERLMAEELTGKVADGQSRVMRAVAEAKVDLNPHQLEAAVFAMDSLSRGGCMLADEVGLGKTIEAGLLLAQKWAERRRRMLVIVPANLRKQWTQELADKFYLPSVIPEARSFNAAVRAAHVNTRVDRRGQAQIHQRL